MAVAVSRLVATAGNGFGLLCTLAPLMGLVAVVVLSAGPLRPTGPDRLSRAAASLHSGRARIYTLAWAPDGVHLAAGSGNGGFTIWDVREHEVDAEFPAPEETPEAEAGIAAVPLAWSRDGSILASRQGSEVVLRDLADQRSRGSFRVPHTTIGCLAFSPDGMELVAGSGDGSALIWDVQAERVRATLTHPGPVTGLAFAPDGRSLVSVISHGTLSLWDSAAGQLRWSSGTESPGVKNSVAFSPDGATIATSGARVELWDAATGRQRRVLKEEIGFFNTLAYSPDGRRLAAISSPGGTITLWETTSFLEVGVYRGRSHGLSLAFAPDGQTLASGGLDGMIELWAVAGDLTPSPSGASSHMR